MSDPRPYHHMHTTQSVHRNSQYACAYDFVQHVPTLVTSRAVEGLLQGMHEYAADQDVQIIVCDILAKMTVPIDPTDSLDEHIHEFEAHAKWFPKEIVLTATFECLKLHWGNQKVLESACQLILTLISDEYCYYNIVARKKQSLPLIDILFSQNTVLLIVSGESKLRFLTGLGYVIKNPGIKKTQNLLEYIKRCRPMQYHEVMTFFCRKLSDMSEQPVFPV